MPSVTEENLFPYESFGVRLQFGEKKELTICWFRDDYDLQKYLNRYKLDKKKVKIDYRDGEPTEPSKRKQNKVRQGTGKTSSGSATTTRGSTKKLDSAGNTSRTRKSKPKTASKSKPKSKPKPKPKSK